uniref:Capsular polysaccharide export protein n=1 Tax=Candidatus Kentrum sp. DK TaxID=2126562 RepID=A0A450TN54_9GAMM|nr:MAG: capsular polysaccharide export protein [Candidatus Kentron sp. DK]
MTCPWHKPALFSPGIRRIPFLAEILGEETTPVYKPHSPKGIDAVLGWGVKSTAKRARRFAARHHLPYVALEDGFLRSFGTGDRFPPLSLVVDDRGIYYDSTRPSALEALLDSDTDLLASIEADVFRARELILCHKLSKYNHAPLLPEDVLRPKDKRRILVVDQTAGDRSVSLGGADATTFKAMLAAARAENPNATIYVKTHPEVSARRKRGYLSQVREDGRTVVLRGLINPLSLMERIDRVYVVSSTMGFEALLAGKPVTCFGLPWYAGWGVTDDRQSCPRRTRKRAVEELFAAAHFHYARYLDPVTHRQGTIFDVIEFLRLQKEMMARHGTGKTLCIGFPRWRAKNVRPFLSLAPGRVHFAPSVAAARRLAPDAADRFVCWGGATPPEIAELARETGAHLVRMEDGFFRSVGLGSDLIAPLSLVLDERGMYFDPNRESDLEHVLNTAAFTQEEIQRAGRIRGFIVTHGITKYNLEPRLPVRWDSGGKRVVLVPGQVEDDASIRLGCEDVRTNLGLLEAARRACPETYLVFKPHPDVASGNRKGKVAVDDLRRLADHVEEDRDIISCIEACDIVHTMTSLSGFDALLRGKKVVVYGRPFYAGWGLTEDHLPMPRRTRKRTLDELAAGTLLRYPLYWDPVRKGYTTCEAVLRRLVERRDALAASGKLERLRTGWLRRQLRKLGFLLRAFSGRV